MFPALKITLCGLIFGSSVAWADCSPPEVPTIPDGSEASMQEMLQGKTDISKYQQANEEYRNCLNEKMEDFNARSAASENKDEIATIKAEHGKMVTAYKKAVGNEEAVADKFNQAIRAYKKANPG